MASMSGAVLNWSIVVFLFQGISTYLKMDDESESCDDITEPEEGHDVDINSDADEVCVEESQEDVPIQNTSPYLSKFEKAKIIGIRAEQICNNAPIMIELDPHKVYSEFAIAEEELLKKKINMIVRRYIGFGRYEDRDVRDLIIR